MRLTPAETGRREQHRRPSSRNASAVPGGGDQNQRVSVSLSELLGSRPAIMPAKIRFVSDLQPNEKVTDYFLVQSKDVRLKRSGEPYLSLNLCDRTGRLEAKMWDEIEGVVETFDRADVIKVSGFIQIYRLKPQMTIQRLRRAEESEFQLADFLPHTDKNIDEMFAELRATVAAMQNPHLKKLLDAFLDDEEIATRLRAAPAAKSLHHACIGGLLEHIISLLNLARLVAGNYDYIDLELVQTGVVLHDLGKIYELGYDRTFEYTNEGQLLGHITIVLRLLDRKCGAIPDFPPRLKTLIEHMILSHHGKYEFGSPKLPSFAEAVMLHYLDDMDSKLENIRASLAADRQDETDWTPYIPSLERPLLKKDRFLNPPERRRAAAAPSTGAPAQKTQRPAAPAQQPQQQGPAAGRPAGGGRPRQPEPRSLFGERLKSALDDEKTPQR